MKIILTLCGSWAHTHFVGFVMSRLVIFCPFLLEYMFEFDNTRIGIDQFEGPVPVVDGQGFEE